MTINNMNNNLNLKKIATIAGLFLGAFAISAFAASWTPPITSAPGGNTGAPINVTTSPQYKEGSLAIGKGSLPSLGFDLEVDGPAIFSGALIAGGLSTEGITKTGYLTVGGSDSDKAGYVLTNKADSAGKATGEVEWKPAGSGNGNSSNNVSVYNFTSRYYELMQNEDFRAWFRSLPKGEAMLKPLSGDFVGKFNNEGWSSSNARITADKLCNFFTNGPSIDYDVDGRGSDNNNHFVAWNRKKGVWESEYSSTRDSTDITRVACLGLNGIIRGVILEIKAKDSTIACPSDRQTYRCQ